MIHALIMTRDHPHYLKLCLRSLTFQVDFATVLDNSERRYNETALVAKSFNAKVIRQDPGISFSQGNNLLAKQVAYSDWLLLVNDDAQVRNGAVSEMLKHRGQSPVIGSMILHSNNVVNHAGVEFRGGVTHHIGRGENLSNWKGDCAEVEAITFAVALIQKDVWDDLGGLDERYYYGYEDTDFCLRAREAGHKIFVCRRSIVTHDEMGTRGPTTDGYNWDIYTKTWLHTKRLAQLPAVESRAGTWGGRIGTL